MEPRDAPAGATAAQDLAQAQRAWSRRQGRNFLDFRRIVQPRRMIATKHLAAFSLPRHSLHWPPKPWRHSSREDHVDPPCLGGPEYNGTYKVGFVPT